MLNADNNLKMQMKTQNKPLHLGTWRSLLTLIKVVVQKTSKLKNGTRGIEDSVTMLSNFGGFHVAHCFQRNRIKLKRKYLNLKV